MKTARTVLAASGIALLLSSLPVAAGELPFQAPATDRARERAQLLHQAARALGDLPASSPLLARDRHISNLWIFPTADENTVFAQYDLSSGDKGAASEKHLAVLKLRGSRIVEQSELADSGTYYASGNERPAAVPHWSTAIGTGHVFSADASSPAHGAPATPHWSARIGTGTAASEASATDGKPPVSSKEPSAVADAHWTSRIGTGHAAESGVRART